MRSFIVLLAVMSLGACASTPQTREEFKNLHIEKSTGSTYSSSILIDSHISQRRFDEVVTILSAKWKGCYNTSRQMSHSTGGTRTMNVIDTYHP